MIWSEAWQPIWIHGQWEKLKVGELIRMDRDSELYNRLSTIEYPLLYRIDFTYFTDDDGTPVENFADPSVLACLGFSGLTLTRYRWIKRDVDIILQYNRFYQEPSGDVMTAGPCKKWYRAEWVPNDAVDAAGVNLILDTERFSASA